MLLDDGELVAILIELADECHGDDRGQWIIESTFGVTESRRAGKFGSADEAADWISQHICRRPFALGRDVTEIG